VREVRARALEISQDAYDLSVHRDRVRCNRTSRFLLRLLPDGGPPIYCAYLYYSSILKYASWVYILYIYIYIGTGRDGRV